MALHRDALALVGTRESEHAAHIVVLHGVLQKTLGHNLGAQRVARHYNLVSDLARGGPYVGRGSLCHNVSIL